MERRSFVSSLPIALGAAFAIKATNSQAQTQTSSLVTNVREFGAVGNGKVDDTAAIAAALKYAGEQTSPMSVFFPDGTYRISSGFMVPAGVSVIGSGRGSAIIMVAVDAITVFSHINTEFAYANITITDLCIQTEYADVIGIQLTLCVTSCIERITFNGCTQCIVIDRGSIHNISNVITQGYKNNPAGTFRFWSSVDTDYVSQVIVNALSYVNTGAGVSTKADVALIYLRRGVICYFNQVLGAGLTEMMPDGSPISGKPGANFIVIENDCQGCKFSQCMGVRPSAGIVLQQGGGIAAYPTFIEFNGVDIDQPTEVAIQVNRSKYVTFNGGMITPNGNYIHVNPIVINPGSEFTTFNATTVYGFFNGSGFYFNGGTYTRLNNCVVDSCYYAFVFAKGNHLRINGGSVTNCKEKFAGSYNADGNYYSQIDGFNPLAVETPPFPPSAKSFANSMGVRCTVYVAGGDVNGIIINGQTLPQGIKSGAFDLEPGDTIAIDYTSSPSWLWAGH